MFEKEEKKVNNEFPDNNQINIKKLNKELNKAINLNDKQSIWKLSKIITRYQVKSESSKEE